MITADTYSAFLYRAAQQLQAAGAEPLALPGGPKPEWAAGWSQVLLVDGPGPSALYAFTDLASAQPQALRARFDHLVAGLSGLVQNVGAPLKVVAVVAAERLPAREARALSRLSPSTYYANIRPAVWVADLAEGRVTTGSRFGQPQGSEWLQATLNGIEASPMTVRPAEAYQVVYHTRPWLTYGLIALNAVIFGLLTLAGGSQNDATLQAFGAIDPRLILQGEWWRLVAAMFLHAGIPHILFNMLSLYAIGTLAERLYGHLRFLLIYLGAGLIGSFVSFGYAVLTGNLDVLGVGASGAIFGVAGALVALRFHRSSLLPPAFRRQVSNAIIPLTLISLVFAYLTPHVDNSAHLGGLAGGILLGLILPLRPAARRAAS